MQQTIKETIKRINTFLNYSKNYFKRKCSSKNFKMTVVNTLKDLLSINKKRKMLKLKLKYQMRQLNQMEKMIAQNSEHAFLKGNKFNEMR